MNNCGLPFTALFFSKCCLLKEKGTLLKSSLLVLLVTHRIGYEKYYKTQQQYTFIIKHSNNIQTVIRFNTTKFSSSFTYNAHMFHQHTFHLQCTSQQVCTKRLSHSFYQGPQHEQGHLHLRTLLSCRLILSKEGSTDAPRNKV